MIISASRRTDIPAFYSRWFMERVREGFCEVPNPFRPSQVSRISLAPADVDCVVFWSKNPAPLIRYLAELDHRGYRYYFQFTLNGYPKVIEAHVPPVKRLITIFRRLADIVGPERVIWRYDPVLLSALTGYQYHAHHFAWLASRLAGYTYRVVISIFDWYPRVAQRLGKPPYHQLQVMRTPQEEPYFAEMVTHLATTAVAHGMTITSCAELIDLQPYGILPGSCIDGALIESLFGVHVTRAKDKGQRPACHCVRSRDIGKYGTCHFGCIYCYGT